MLLTTLSCESENPCGYGQDWHQHSDGTYTCVTPAAADNIVDKANPEFNAGYDAGYKAGWCYVDTSQGYGCLEPFSPFPPFPNFGETTYQHGYNRGFVEGKEEREKS